MSHQPELVRWVDDLAKSESLRGALREQGEEGPTSAQRARMFEQLADEVSQEPITGDLPSAGKPLRKAVLWGAGMLLLGSAAWWASRTPAPGAPATAVAPVSAPKETNVPEPAVRHDAPVPALDPAPAPLLEKPRPALHTRPKRASAPVPASPRVDPVLELALLTKARRVLTVQPHTALEIAAEHERDYPQGLLTEEREVIAIEALVKLGRRAQAAQRAQRFLARFPGSAQRARLDQLLRDALHSDADNSEALGATPH